MFLIDSLGPGGAERSTAAIAPRLAAHGLHVQIVTLYTAGEGYADDVHSTGVEVITLRSTSYGRRILETRRLLRREQPDVLHTALFASDQIGRLAAVGTSTKVVSSWVNVPRTRKHAPPGVQRWKVLLVNLIDAITGHLCVDRFHAVTQGVARLYRSAYRINSERVQVVERGRDIAATPCDSAVRRLVRERLGVTEGAPVIIAAGRLDHQKGHVDLICAMPKVLGNHPDAVLLIAGRNGNASARVSDTIAAQDGLASRVRLLGHRPDVLDLLRASDVMALPSHFEGTAGIALEAMAVSTPIVSTDLEGMEGILVHNSTALLVPVDDSDALATAIIQLLDDPMLSRRLANAARDEFYSRFTLERSAERTIEMYRSVLASAGR